MPRPVRSLLALSSAFALRLGVRGRVLVGGLLLLLAVGLVAGRVLVWDRLVLAREIARTGRWTAEAAEALAAAYGAWYDGADGQGTAASTAAGTFTGYTEALLRRFEGVEGGFYSADDSTFYGFAFPTSPPPAPAYGPPPREVALLIDVAREAMQNRATVTRWVSSYSRFGVSAAPVLDASLPDRPYGAAWTLQRRQDLTAPAALDGWFLLPFALALVGGGVLLSALVGLRRQALAVRRGLGALTDDLSQLLPEPADPDFAAIARAANGLAASLTRARAAEAALARQIARQERAASLGRFAGAVAHEVRTPLAGVKARLQLWLRRAPAHVADDPVLPDVIAQLDRLDGVIEHLYRLTSVGRLPLERGPVGDAVRRATEAMRPRAEAAGAALDARIPDDLPEVDRHPVALEGVVQNLVANALEAGARRVRVLAGAHEGGLGLEVHDDGPGLPPDAARLFEPFYTTRPDGLGLGLALALETARHHGGTLQAHDSPLGGACFRLTLPAPAPDDPPDA
ncbi:MAG: sensor histidine kinase [Rubricoccaceae bacterium]